MDCNIAKFEMIKDIGSGNFGVAKLMKDRQTGELVAVKFIERGEKIDKCAALRFTRLCWLHMHVLSAACYCPCLKCDGVGGLLCAASFLTRRVARC